MIITGQRYSYALYYITYILICSLFSLIIIGWENSWSTFRDIRRIAWHKFYFIFTLTLYIVMSITRLNLAIRARVICSDMESHWLYFLFLSVTNRGDAMKRIQINLHQKRYEEAVGLMRSCRWVTHTKMSLLTSAWPSLSSYLYFFLFELLFFPLGRVLSFCSYKSAWIFIKHFFT